VLDFAGECASSSSESSSESISPIESLKLLIDGGSVAWAGVEIAKEASVSDGFKGAGGEEEGDEATASPGTGGFRLGGGRGGGLLGGGLLGTTDMRRVGAAGAGAFIGVSISDLHGAHTRTGFPPLILASTTLSLEQLAQTIKPHFLQWCRRKNVVNSALHLPQSPDVSSGRHIGATNAPEIS
jgi:hypothetical protein